MKNASISTTYDLIWRIKSHPHLQVSNRGEIINVLTNRKRKMSVNGYSTGVWLDSRTFILKSNLNSLLEKIPNIDCPF